MSRYALVNKVTHIADNVCLWDGDTSTWQPDAQHDAIASDVANVGDLYDPNAGTFTPQPPPPDPLANSWTILKAFYTDAQVDTLIATDPATLNATQQILRKLCIAFRALERVERADQS